MYEKCIYTHSHIQFTVIPMEKKKKLKGGRTPKEIKRVRTNVTLTPMLFQKVKDYDLNLSSFLQIKLAEYFAYIEGNIPRTQTIQTYTPDTHHQGIQTSRKLPGKTNELYGGMGLLRFAPTQQE